MTEAPRVSQANLWGLVLAAGEGKRLESYVRQLRGQCLPKQYVNFIGTRSMLEHTLDRAERLIPRRQILTVVAEHHLLANEVRRQLSIRAPGTVIVQPENRDTGLGILLPLTYLYKHSPDATVAIFPSDHFILEEDRFMDHVRLAVHAVDRDPSQLVLLAMEAQWAEPDYGYVVAADSSGHLDLCGCLKVIHFVEKPGLADARLLFATGAFWNTMIMVFNVATLLHRIRMLFPEIAIQFDNLAETIGTSAEKNKLRELYGKLSPVNFSRDILEKITVHSPGSVAVLPVLHVTWSDWGSPQRLNDIKQVIKRSIGEPARPATWSNRAAPTDKANLLQ